MQPVNPGHFKLHISDITSSKIEYDGRLQQFLIKASRKHFQRVRIMGIIVEIDDAQILLDDSTGIIAIQYYLDEHFSKFQVGQLVDCLGLLKHPKGNRKEKSRFIVASGIRIVKDPNEESLRMSEMVDLYRNYYFNPGTIASSRKKNSRPPIEEPMQEPHTRGPSTILAQPEQGTEGKYVLERELPESKTRKIADERRKSWVEIRLFKPPYAALIVGDVVKFNGVHSRRVDRLRKFSSLKLALELVVLEELLLECRSKEDALSHYRQYFTEQDEHGYGVLVIHFGRILDSFDEFIGIELEPLGQQIFKLLENRPSGMMQTDFEKEFYQFGVSQISEALSQLQMDGLVYVTGGKYFIL